MRTCSHSRTTRRAGRAAVFAGAVLCGGFTLAAATAWMDGGRGAAQAPYSASGSAARLGDRLHAPPPRGGEAQSLADSSVAAPGGAPGSEFTADEPGDVLAALGARGNARAEATAQANEAMALAGQEHGASGPYVAQVLVIPVEFAGAETLEYFVRAAGTSQCVTVTNTFTGPLHGAIPYPGGSPASTIDNATTYYASTEPEDYARLIFGRTGITEPLRAGDANVNGGMGADVTGLTVQSYYAAQSDDTVVITGTVAPWVSSEHSQAYYGLDMCIPGMSAAMIPDEQLGSLAGLAVASAEALKALGGEYAEYDFWKRFDGDGDGLVDDLWLIHAGRGQEYMSGSQAAPAIYSRATDVRRSEDDRGYVIHDNGNSNPADDVRIGPFVVDPEDSDIGVLVEEFGHSRFSLPDLYTRGTSNSVGWWAPMSSGIWGGELAGTRPVNMPLWFRMIADCGGQPCGWAEPIAVVPYTTTGETVVLGEAGTPAGGSVADGPRSGATIHEGLRIDLPPQLEAVPNRAGDGGGAYSTSQNGVDLVLRRAVSLPAAADPIMLAFDSLWQITTNWSYAYVEISTNGGATFVSVPDVDGRFTNANPYGLNEGYGLTGSGSGRLRFDLSDYGGREVVLRLRYLALQGGIDTGWWVDNVGLTGSADEPFEDGLGAWSADGWHLVPYTAEYAHNYLVEWRNASGFDRSLDGASVTTYVDDDEWRVTRVPANVPGALVMYRNTKYPFNGALLDNLDDPPSMGAKYGLLVLDTSFWPRMRPNGRALPGSLASLDAALALQDQPDYTLEIWDAASRTRSTPEALDGSPGISLFDDAKGYCPGFKAEASGTPTPWAQDASVVVPSRDGRIYSTRITWPDRSRPHPLDGAPAAAKNYLGSGDPGDADAQLGVHVEVVDRAADGSWGAVRVSWRGAYRAYLPICQPLAPPIQ